MSLHQGTKQVLHTTFLFVFHYIADKCNDVQEFKKLYFIMAERKNTNTRRLPEKQILILDCTTFLTTSTYIHQNCHLEKISLLSLFCIYTWNITHLEKGTSCCEPKPRLGSSTALARTTNNFMYHYVPLVPETVKTLI
jgi:hypothetical protein